MSGVTTATRAPRGPLSERELQLLDAYWRAANYLSVGQIYLLDNALLRKPLAAEHVKPRLLGHWGTTPGLNFIYAHMNRAIRARELNAIFVTGPGHGGPGVVANTYLEGTYSEVYPPILLPGRHPESRRARDARLDPRGRRARLRAAPRVRGRL
jgi:xylulose-5-phosphate/fructose-6-phosphate phosphoketolase